MSDRDERIRQALQHGRTTSSGWVRVHCPGFCEATGKGPDRRQSFGFNPRTGGYSCNRCKAHGRLGGHVVVGADRGPRPAEALSRRGLVPMWGADAERSLALEDARRYLAGRGLTPAMVRHSMVHAAVSGKYSGRVVFPHVDEFGEWWGFTARCWTDDLDEDAVKVLYPGGMARRLYNDQALLEETDVPCYLVEGTIDAAAYLPNAAAFLGKPTEEHFEQLLHSRRPLVFALDGDAWEESRWWSVRTCFNGIPARWVKLPAGRDPNDVEVTALDTTPALTRRTTR